MTNKIDPKLMRDLERFGLKDACKCAHCGNCTAMCHLSTPDNPFPRRFVRYIQLGQRDKILSSAEPWLCYYCGECSERCPRGADPGETMMVLRRYLTSAYDWTGFSRRFYTSESFELVAVAVVAGLVGLALWFFNTGHPNWEHADVNSLWPAASVEIADLVMAGILSFLLLSNSYRCVKFIMGDLLGKVPLRIYASQLKHLVIHGATQKRLGECKDRMPWYVHLLIMTGYATVFLMVVVLLNGLGSEGWKFQRGWPEYPLWNPIRLAGYYATFGIMYGTTYAILGRLKKSRPAYKNSHATDWMFLILLQATTVTGILIHVARLVDWPAGTYGLYAVHMMAAIPMLVLEVPFAKWAHLAYRPLALYLVEVKRQYHAEASAPEQTAVAVSPEQGRA
ncbi:MAG: 4Fe-4S dicluster domain-containing protein [Deltaproteobacteria bacterium]|nr:4Fe-4S dicluster domain-containing protein [Deltaproteobacteria bacterium]